MGYVKDPNDYGVIDKLAAEGIKQNDENIEKELDKSQVTLELDREPEEEEDPWNAVPLFRVEKKTPWKG